MWIYRLNAGVANLTAFMTLFEQYLRDLGWTIVSGAGTTDIVVSSNGEQADAKKLFARIWVTGGNTLNWRVQDDAAGTHVTTAATAVKGAGNIDMYLSGDKDMVVMHARPYATMGLTGIFGMTMPFDLHIPDCTYRMISSNAIAGGKLLRKYDGTWDQAMGYVHNQPRIKDRYNNRVQLYAMIIACGTQYVGELKHVSCQLYQNAIMLALDTCDTTSIGGTDTTSWICLEVSLNIFFCMRTGGVQPIGFDSEDNPTVLYPLFISRPQDVFDNLWPMLNALGWTRTNNSGISGEQIDWIYHSTGNSGAEDINIRVDWRSDLTLYFQIRDAAGAHIRDAGIWDLNSIPCKMLLGADKECIYGVVEGGEGSGIGILNFGNVFWAGKTQTLNNDLYVGNSEYSMAIFSARTYSSNLIGRLRDHDGTWTPGNSGGEINTLPVDTPQRLDALSIPFAPVVCISSSFERYGILKYIYRTNFLFPCITDPGDEYRYANKRYKCFFYVNVVNYSLAVRIL